MDEGRLIIDWTQMPTYNTIMSLAVGAALLSLVSLGRTVLQNRELHPEGWALNFGVLGFILTLTGGHMTLTWPLAAYFPFDNIVFGETSLGFGVLLLAAAFYLWRRAEVLRTSPDPARELAQTGRPFRFIIFGLGLALVAIACAGIRYQLFAAPPEEPISGQFANYPWVEAIFISGLFALVGVAALLFPFALQAGAGDGSGARTTPTAVQRWTGGLLGLTGLAFLLFGALNYFTHIGLIINTMPN